MASATRARGHSRANEAGEEPEVPRGEAARRARPLNRKSRRAEPRAAHPLESVPSVWLFRGPVPREAQRCPSCWRPGILDGARCARRPAQVTLQSRVLCRVWSRPSSLCPSCHRLSPGCLPSEPPWTPRTGVLRTRRAPAPRAHRFHLSLVSGPSICPSAVTSACGGGCARGDRWLRLAGRWLLWGASGFPLRPGLPGCVHLCPSAQVGPCRPPWDPGCMAGRCGLLGCVCPQVRPPLGLVGTSPDSGMGPLGTEKELGPGPRAGVEGKVAPPTRPALGGLTAPEGERKGVPWVSRPAGGTLPGTPHLLSQVGKLRPRVQSVPLSQASLAHGTPTLTPSSPPQEPLRQCPAKADSDQRQVCPPPQLTPSVQTACVPFVTTSLAASETAPHPHLDLLLLWTGRR